MTRSLLRLVGLALLLVPLLPQVPIFWVSLADTIGMATLVALGLVVLTGVGGMTSFGQAAFVGFGAYTAAVLTLDYGVNPWATLPASLVVTAAAAALLGLVTVRLSGHYLPLGTLAWGLAAFFLFGNLDLVGGHNGLSGLPALSIGGITLTDPRSFWPVVAVGLVAGYGLTANLLSSRIGRAIRALRQSAQAAESFGIDTARVKLIVFVHAAMLAGLSGWMFAFFQRAIAPSSFGLSKGIDYLLMAVAGGSGHLGGALAGAAIVTIVEDWLQDLMPKLIGVSGSSETIVFGILLVLLLQHARHGLWPLIAARLPWPKPAVSQTPEAAAPLPARPRLSPGTPVIEARQLVKRFGGLVAVDTVGFTAAAGRIVGLIGPNGAGKSTTFNLVSGLTRPTSGSVTLAGIRTETLPGRAIARLGLARTFQHVKLVPEMSVLDNVALGGHLRGRAGVVAAMLRLNRTEEAALLAEARRQIARVGLDGLADRPAGSLALGQLRLVEVARALMLDPLILLLDEPAAGLRHQEKQALARLLDRLRREGVGVLLVEHDMDFVMTLTDHLVVLNFGTVIAEGTPAEVRANPAVIAAYLGGAA